MTILGDITEPTSTAEAWAGTNYSLHGHVLTFPGGGPWLVQTASVWAAGYGVDTPARLVVWDGASGNVIGYGTADVTLVARAFSASGSDLYSSNVYADGPGLTPLVVGGGATVIVGFQRQTSGSYAAFFGRRASGSHRDKIAASYLDDMASSTTDGSGEMGAYIEYIASNTAPYAPTITAPAGGQVIAGTSTSIVASYSDPEGDDAATYDCQIDTTSGNGVEPDWAGLTLDVNDSSSGIDEGANTITRASGTLSRNQWYAARMRIKDPGGLESPWSLTRFFVVNALPTASAHAPADLALCRVINLAEETPSVWTSAGAHAVPLLRAVYTDPDAHPCTAYRVKLYADSAGSKGATIYDSGKTATSLASGAAFEHIPAQALVMGTQYWWAVEFWDSYDESSGAIDSSTARRFKVRWGQVIYEFNAGVATSAWQFSNSPIGGVGTFGSFHFATATGPNGAGRSGWVSNIGSLNPANGPYLNVMVRLSTTVAGTDPTLPDMTFSYLAAAIQPDKWVFGGVSDDWRLDESIRRFGRRSLKMLLSTTSARDLYPFRLTPGDDIPVQRNTTYVLSAFVNTLGVGLSKDLHLRVYPAGSLTGALFVGSIADGGATDQTDLAVREGWVRLLLVFTTDASTSLIRPAISYPSGGVVGETFWVDAFKLEEGAVATAWAPGSIGAVILDSGGFVADGAAGGIWRLRGTAGGTRDLVELGPHGLVLGGDTAISTGATAFPSSPTVDEQCYRKDLGMWFFYDGTRWLSTTLFETFLPSVSGLTATTSAAAPSPNLRGGSNIWLVDANLSGFHVNAGGSALSASHKWLVRFDIVAPGGTLNDRANFTIDSGASDVWRQGTPGPVAAIDTLMGAQVLWQITCVKTGTPGNLSANLSVTYRIVG